VPQFDWAKGKRVVEISFSRKEYLDGGMPNGPYSIIIHSVTNREVLLSELYIVDIVGDTLALIGAADQSLIAFEEKIKRMEEEERKHPGLVRMRLMVQEDE